MKYLFNKETLFATLSVFLVMWIFIIIPLNFEPLNPIKLALTDINFNDLSFSKLKTHKVNGFDDRIIIINIGESGRRQIAQLLNKIAPYNTKAIGMDILFQSPKEPQSDYELATAIQKIPNIILTDRLEWNQGRVYHHNFFNAYAEHSGYVNFIGEDQTVVRYFSPFETWRDTVNKSFATAVAQMADDKKFERLKKRNNEVELINYRRQVDQFFIINDSDILNNNVDASVFKNKIVLIGYINDDSTNIEDKHFTPLNDKFVGKSLPDMNGIIIQANIILMILDNDYITVTPTWVNWLIAFFAAWLFMAVALRYYIDRHLWYHVVTHAIQLVLAFLIVYLGIIILNSFHVSIDFSITLLAIIVALDVLIFYETFMMWLHKKYGVKTIFHKSKHT